MDDVKAKQQIVEKIKASTNILVTVSNDPSVDALSAALGLTMVLDKLEKHPTAIFSGAVPPAISFLEPEKTFDSTTDSLRDFIIALDKSKADHLRYKVEGDSVKIFITPYKTTITKDDLDFSQGEVNVELVIALGVDNQDHLDKALESHGQILHDATIITATAGDQTSTLGGIDWHDAQSSSLSEMIAGLTEALKSDKNQSLLDGPIATAFLTGIVAQTDRFSNTHTTSRVMTIAAQLMTAGADQQLIASKLEDGDQIGQSKAEPEKSDPTELKVSDEKTGETAKDTLDISLHPNETLEEMDKRVKAAEQAQAATVAEDVLAKEIGATTPTDTVSETTTPEISNAYAPEADAQATEPSLGGTLNATSEQAAEDNRAQMDDEKNKTILSHSYVGSPDIVTPTPPPSEDKAHEFLEANGPAPGSNSVNAATPPATGELVHSAYAVDDTAPENGPPPAVPSPEVTPDPTPAPVPSLPPAPADLGLPMPPEVPDFSQLPPLPTTQPRPEILGDILADSSAPASPAPTPPAPASPSLPPLPTQPGPNDPGQFKIPGQP